MKYNATAAWNGTGKEGTGYLTTQSTALNKTQYSFNSLFAEGVGTNPDELVAASHAGCFSMKLSFVLNAAGFTADAIETNCVITFDPAQGAITESALTVTASVPGINQEQFEAFAADAKANCPISKLLTANITMVATLMQ
jgi:lipoyl-dependent peroxiredoxin